MKICPNQLCQSNVSDDAEFCPACGEEIPHPIIKAGSTPSIQGVNHHSNIHPEHTTHSGVIPPPIYTPPAPPKITSSPVAQVSSENHKIATQDREAIKGIEETTLKNHHEQSINNGQSKSQNTTQTGIEKYKSEVIKTNSEGASKGPEGSKGTLGILFLFAIIALSIYLEASSSVSESTKPTQQQNTTNQTEAYYHTGVYFNHSTKKYSIAITTTSGKDALQNARIQCENQGGNCTYQRAPDGRCLSIAPRSYIGYQEADQKPYMAIGKNIQEADDKTLAQCQSSCKVVQHLCFK